MKKPWTPDLYQATVAALLSLGSTGPVASQNWQWAELTPASSTLTAYNEVLSDPEGNFILCGRLQGSAQFGAYQVTSEGVGTFIAKLSSSGEWMWAVAGEGWGNGYFPSLAVDALGDIYVSGDFQDSVRFGAFSLYTTESVGGRSFVAKLSGAGDWVWAIDVHGHVSDIDVNAVGELYVAGHYTSPGEWGGFMAEVAPNATEAFIGKLSPSSEWLWVRTSQTQPTGTSPAGCQFKELAVDATNNTVYAVGGYSNGIVTIGPSTLEPLGMAAPVVCKVDGGGNVEWGITAEEYLVNMTQVELTDIQLLSPGRLMINGTLGAPGGGGIVLGADTTFTVVTNRSVLAEVNATGDWVSSDYVGTYGNDFTFETMALGPVSAGTLAVTGLFEEDLSLNGISVPHTGTMDLLIATLDAATAQFTWAGSISSANAWLNGVSIAGTPNGTFCLTGHLHDGTIQLGSHTLTDTIPGWGGTMFTALFTPGSTGLVARVADGGPALFPNPCSDAVGVRLPAGQGPVLLEVFGSTGERVFVARGADAPFVTLNSADWAEGLYIVQARSAGSVVLREKLVVQR